MIKKSIPISRLSFLGGRQVEFKRPGFPYAFGYKDVDFRHYYLIPFHWFVRAWIRLTWFTGLVVKVIRFIKFYGYYWRVPNAQD